MSHRNTVSRTSDAMVSLAIRVIVTALVVWLLFLGISRVYSFGHGLLYEHAMEQEPGTDVSVEISEGQSSRQIAEMLEKDGLIDNTTAFVLQVRLYEGVFEPGSYTLNTSMTTADIINKLTDEGKKLQELKQKDLVNADAAEAETKSTGESGVEEIGGGNEGE